MYGLHAGNRHELMYMQFTFDNPTATPLRRIVVTCLLSLIFAINLLTPCESSISTGLERPYAFRVLNFLNKDTEVGSSFLQQSLN